MIEVLERAKRLNVTIDADINRLAELQGLERDLCVDRECLKTRFVQHSFMTYCSKESGKKSMAKSKITMSKIIYRRCSLTLDPVTIRKCKELSVSKGQSVWLWFDGSWRRLMRLRGGHRCWGQAGITDWIIMNLQIVLSVIPDHGSKSEETDIPGPLDSSSYSNHMCALAVLNRQDPRDRMKTGRKDAVVAGQILWGLMTFSGRGWIAEGFFERKADIEDLSRHIR